MKQLTNQQITELIEDMMPIFESQSAINKDVSVTIAFNDAVQTNYNRTVFVLLCLNFILWIILGLARLL